jgi:hypothetical protein
MDKEYLSFGKSLDCSLDLRQRGENMFSLREAAFDVVSSKRDCSQKISMVPVQRQGGKE